MALISRIVGGIRALLDKREIEREMDEELRGYLELSADRKIAAGMSRADAMRAARIEMSGIEAAKERIRDVGWESFADSCWQDVRYAVRGLKTSRGFAAVAILTLALGIGANTAIFSVVNALLLRALPVAEPQRLATVSSSQAAAQGATAPWTYPIWEAIRERAAMFGGALAWAPQSFNLAQGGETEPVDGLFVSGEFFSTLGVPMRLGRAFTAADDVRGSSGQNAVAIINYRLWQRRFGGAANVIGTTLVIERVPFTIIGVTSPEFFGTEVGQTFDVALPFASEPLVRSQESWLEERRTYWLTVMLRLKPGQSFDSATAALRAVQPQIRAAAVDPAAPPRSQQLFFTDPVVLVPAASGISRLRDRYEQPLLIILVVVALVLVIACANIANLLLARATTRRHELSVRLALGAPRRRLVRQMLVESLILCAAGSVVGLIVAAWGSRALVAQLSTSAAPVFLDVSIDWRVLLFTGLTAIATAVLFGMAPAFRATRVPPIDALKDHSRVGMSGRVTLSNGLVIAQIALSVVLVVGAGLFVRTFQELARVGLGFDSDRILVVNVNGARASLNGADRSALAERLLVAVAAVPGVAKAAASELTPVSGRSWNFPADVAGAPPMADGDRFVRGHAITPGWLATYGTRLHAGRDIQATDTSVGPRVALVNEAFARRFFPGQNAIGRTFAEPAFGRSNPVERRIVGVVGDAIYRSLREDPQPTIYVPLAQRGGPGGREIRISVRSAGGPPAALARSIAAALTALDRNLAFSFRPLEEQVAATLIQDRLLALLSAVFGGLALLLAGLGLYGTTSYAVTRRQTEIGIRMALGARRSDVMALVLGRSSALTLVGIALGLAAAVAATRLVGGMLYGLTPLDPATFIGVSFLFAVVTTAASVLPARRATKVDPLIAFKAE